MTDAIIYSFKKYGVTQTKEGKQNTDIRTFSSLKGQISCKGCNFMFVSSTNLLTFLFRFFVSCKEHRQVAMAYVFYP